MGIWYYYGMAPYCITCQKPMRKFGFTAGQRIPRWRCRECKVTIQVFWSPRRLSGFDDGKQVRKLELFTKAARLYQDGSSLRGVIAELGLSFHTACRYRKLALANHVVLCACGKSAGHKEWCEWRINKSPARQSYLVRCASMSAASLARIRPTQPPMLTTWPYVRSFDNDDYALMKYVNEIVPRALPEHVRADVCQDILVDVVSGEISADQLKNKMKEYVRRAYKFMPSKFGAVSLDAFIYGEEGATFGERLIG